MNGDRAVKRHSCKWFVKGASARKPMFQQSSSLISFMPRSAAGGDREERSLNPARSALRWASGLQLCRSRAVKVRMDGARRECSGSQCLSEIDLMTT